MCWSTTKELTIKIAPQDITVYKFLTPTFFKIKSPCQDFKYKFNKIYTESRFEKELQKYNKTFGFHSYSGFTEVLTISFLHISVNVPSGGYWPLLLCNRIYKCIIPKGTRYFENKFGEIISEQIKITRHHIKITKRTKYSQYLKDLK